MLDGGEQIVRDVGLDSSFSEGREETGQDSSLGDGGEEGGDPECFRLHNVLLLLFSTWKNYLILFYLFRGGCDFREWKGRRAWGS